jgi:hypothetical protein
MPVRLEIESLVEGTNLALSYKQTSYFETRCVRLSKTTTLPIIGTTVGFIPVPIPFYISYDLVNRASFK